MNRLFTKNATGVATDGRWYAGDINAVQDVVAALLDLTQNLGVGTIQVGESGLQIVRYGAGEMRVTGALRIDAIVRALGGLYVGAYTTTARNAIVLPPYGLVITNTTTNQLEINLGSTTVPDWQPVGRTAAQIHLSGTYAARPAANTVLAGVRYFATDTLGEWMSDGVVWNLVNQRAPLMSMGTFATFPGPYDGQEVVLEADAAAGVNWRFRYNAGSANTDKWECVGGSAFEAITGDAGMVIGQPNYNVTLTSASIFALPRPGVYRIEAIVSFAGTTVNANSSGSANTSIVAGGTPTVIDTGGATSHDYTTGQGFFSGRIGLAGRYAGATGDQVKLRGSSGGSYQVSYTPIMLRVTPLRIS